MKTKNIERYLESFGKYVVKQSKTILSKKKKNVTKKLYNSIKFEVTKDSVKFFMLDYGSFVDKGVSGNKKIQEYITYDGRKIESPYKYTTKGPPIDIISKWIKKRGIKVKGLGRGRSKTYTRKDGTEVKGTGRFLSGFAYLISKKIKRDGIKGIGFFQRPLQLGLKNFPKDFLKALKEDILEGITTVKVN